SADSIPLGLGQSLVGHSLLLSPPPNRPRGYRAAAGDANERRRRGLKSGRVCGRVSGSREGGTMTQTSVLMKLKRAHWRSLERMLRQAYQEGFEAGLARAHGQGRRGRTIRADATVDGLVRLI